MAFASAAFATAGLVSSSVGAWSQASTQKSAMNAAADVAEANAMYADWQASSVLEAGRRDESRQRVQTAQLKGTQRAAMAANGVDLGTGTAAHILTTTDILGEEDARTIRMNAIEQAFGVRVEATNQRNEARMARAGAKSISPLSAGVTTLLNGSGQVASSWYSWDKNRKKPSASAAYSSMGTSAGSRAASAASGAFLKGSG